MQTGIVEGAIGAGAEGYYSNLRDLVKYYLPVNDHFEMWFLYMNKETFNKLSPNQQKALQDAAKAMETKRFADAEQQEENTRKNWKKTEPKLSVSLTKNLRLLPKKSGQRFGPLSKMIMEQNCLIVL
jgi:TRAP-type C4-dicarboxylate transport system substrate-binding protein